MVPTLAQIYVPMIATLGASAVAVVGSFYVGRGMRSQEWKLSLVRERLLERQRLYARFIAEADRNLLLLLSGKEAHVDNVMPVLALYAEISLLSTEAVLQGAKRVCDLAISANGQEPDPQSDHYGVRSAFVEAARSELAALETDALLFR
ncbi:hypothetical protein B0I00_3129 [Novosphingobium kunmingense]|uniref:Uncharacterized protein n=2 Tax=Novosphingobium kunmingense TaxID=1211806 RepID=A0A2N0H430_9SPHN|nr:hypothetical protein B0I00_3129 [Novosphingobium kunmingense]